MPKLRVHNFTISLDGYAAGPNQGLENPMGIGGMKIHEWAIATRSWRASHGMEGGSHRRNHYGTKHVRPDPKTVDRRRLEGLVG